MKKIILTALIAFCSFGLFAQPQPPPFGHGESGDQQGAPLDGGLSVLLVLGAAYGAKELKSKRKEAKEKEESN